MKYGLLGKKLGHSFSKQIHAMLDSYSYDMFEKDVSDLDDFIVNGDYDGLNVTIPYKKTVMKYCNSLSEYAEKIGSVNTITKENGFISGYNTDYYGFEFMIRNSRENIEGAKIVVLGNGGASATIQAVLRDMNAAKIIVVSRRREEGCCLYEEVEEYQDAEFIVNTTPVGMYPNNGESPVDIDIFKNVKAVFDIIYNPKWTKLLLDAKKRGMNVYSGLPMLVAQAKRACEIFSKRHIPDERILEIVNIIENENMNIILIGMPGCGKTTAGKELSKLTNREFIDTDSLVEQEAGKSIPEIFNIDGEDYFRKLESRVLKNVTSLSGKIIATGGGIVTRMENYDYIKQQGVIIFLDRDIKLLATDGRPLSKQRRLEDIYSERIEKYISWSDVKVDAINVDQVVVQIQKYCNLCK